MYVQEFNTVDSSGGRYFRYLSTLWRYFTFTRLPQQIIPLTQWRLKPMPNSKLNRDYDLNSSVAVKFLWIRGREVSKSFVTAADKTFNFYPICHLSVRALASPKVTVYGSSYDIVSVVNYLIPAMWRNKVLLSIVSSLNYSATHPLIPCLSIQWVLELQGYRGRYFATDFITRLWKRISGMLLLNSL